MSGTPTPTATGTAVQKLTGSEMAAAIADGTSSGFGQYYYGTRWLGGVGPNSAKRLVAPEKELEGKLGSTVSWTDPRGGIDGGIPERGTSRWTSDAIHVPGGLVLELPR